jgi:hypothetical protein
MHPGFLWPGAVANTAEALAAAAVKLHESEESFAEAQQCGWDLLRDQFDAARLGPALVQRVEALRSQLTAHRQANFVGAMLRHHLHHSTLYLSKYLELKGANDARHPQGEGQGSPRSS